MQSNLEHVVKHVNSFHVYVNAPQQNKHNPKFSNYLINRRSVLSSGLFIHEYQNPTSFFSNILLMDQDTTAIGSYTFTLANTYFNTSTMLVIKSAAFNQLMREKIKPIEDDSLIVRLNGHYIDDDKIKPLTESKIDHLLQIAYGILTQLFRNVL